MSVVLAGALLRLVLVLICAICAQSIPLAGPA